MSNKVKDIDIKNRRYYFNNDIINIKNLYPSNTKIDEKSHKGILIYYPYWIWDDKRFEIFEICKS